MKINTASTPSREFILLCWLISADPKRERINDMLRKPIDWMTVADLAERHGVRPLLMQGLDRMDFFDLPPETKELLEDFQKWHVSYCLRVGAELLGIVELLEGKHVRFATFKGATLAVSLYGDISRREFNDIDLVVHETDLEAAENCLRSRGYRARSGDRAYREAFMAYQNQYIFQMDETMIDLHWDFSVTGVPFPLQAAEIWGSLEKVSIAGRDVPTLGRYELALYLAGHGTKHGWNSLSWVCDFAHFIQAYRQINWMRLWHRSVRRHSGNPILLGSVLASRLLDAPVDEELLACADREPIVQASADAAMKGMMSPAAGPASAPEDFLGGLDLCETWPQKAAVLWRLVSTRTTSDYEAMPLPRPTWRLYHLTRPVRLGIRVLSALRTKRLRAQRPAS